MVVVMVMRRKRRVIGVSQYDVCVATLNDCNYWALDLSSEMSRGLHCITLVVMVMLMRRRIM